MREEIAAVLQSLANVKVRELGGRHFHQGTFHDEDVVVVFSRYGKVAAASTVTQLIASYPVTRLIFSGVAGGAGAGIRIGDVVIATDLIQHDMDASPLFPRYEVPLLGKARFAADPELRRRLKLAAESFLQQDLAACVPDSERSFFAIHTPGVTEGLIASGDKFFASAGEIHELRLCLPHVACVEMEGAAVAQVCDEYTIPFGVIRTISDSANEQSVHDFPRFAREIAQHYSQGILARFMRGT